MKFYFYVFKPLCVFLILCLLSPQFSLAAEGDTTNIYVHDAVDMVWNENYNQMGYFPDGSKSYRKITMFYTLGCSSNGCSDWDYTTQVFLVPDPSDGTQNLELGRVITPYGGYMADGANGFDNSWSHTYAFDVTDFAPRLMDSVQVRAFYDGWSDGFSISLRFEFIEGTPPRDIIAIDNLYRGRDNYNTPVSFDISNFPFKDVSIPANAEQTKVRISITGHGFDNNTGCAEFCERSYAFKVNGFEVGSALMWRGDCGLNPIYPQGGTWIYNRADWCPGDKSNLHEHELTPFLTPGTDAQLDLNIQNYTWSGDQAPYYIYDVQLVHYGAMNFNRDVELVDILSPSMQDPYSRHNPICGNPKIKVRNTGATTATSITFTYGVEGGASCAYTWFGTLPTFEEAEIELPTPSWADLDPTNPVFEVSISAVNGSADDYAWNNTLSSAFEVTPKYNGPIVWELLTNNQANENSYTLTDSEGSLIMERAEGSLSPSTQYSDTFNLDPGCYTFRLWDSGGQGLYWWNNQGAGVGSLRLKYATGQPIKTFQTDFGSEVYYQFTIGDLEAVPQGGDCMIVATEDIDITRDNKLSISPNPNNGHFTLRINGLQQQEADFTVVDLLGKVIYQERLNTIGDGYNKEIILKDVAKGVYLVQLRYDEELLSKKVVIQ